MTLNEFVRKLHAIEDDIQHQPEEKQTLMVWIDDSICSEFTVKSVVPLENDLGVYCASIELE